MNDVNRKKKASLIVLLVSLWGGFFLSLGGNWWPPYALGPVSIASAYFYVRYWLKEVGGLSEWNRKRIERKREEARIRKEEQLKEEGRRRAR